MRWAITGTVVTVAALIAGMNVEGDGVELFGLLGLGIAMNFTAALWACGVAMFLRTEQAGALIQMPVFVLLFLAPVYVPLSLLSGWIHDVANLNPVTAVLEAGRGLLAGTPVKVAAAFLGLAIIAALLRCSPGAVWPPPNAPGSGAPPRGDVGQIALGSDLPARGGLPQPAGQWPAIGCGVALILGACALQDHRSEVSPTAASSATSISLSGETGGTPARSARLSSIGRASAPISWISVGATQATGFWTGSSSRPAAAG